MYTAAAIFAVLGLGCLFLVALGLPGTWLILGLATAMELLDHLWLDADVVTFGWPIIVAGLALAVVGELIELVTGAIGTKLGGGRNKGMLGSFLGGLVGAIVCTPLLPIIGTLIGALIGTFAGALIAETTGKDPMERKDASKAAIMATIGRVMGTVAKMGIATVVWLGLTVAAFWG